MTRDAAALVIGVDRYDVPDIPILSGSVFDARTAVRWLLDIGVPPERIRLHIAPNGPRPADLEGVPTQVATLDSILASMDELRKGRGEQLFIFMSGHGLRVPAGGSIFLAQDYGSDWRNIKNIAIDDYITWFLSWPYKDQFLFYDACQNPSTSVGRVSLVDAKGPPVPLASLPVATPNALTACWSASPGQTAWAGDGRGVLVRLATGELDPVRLAALPPDAEQQDAILYDWNTGGRRVDLRRLFTSVIGQAIQQEAAAAKKSQLPFCTQHGRATADGISPILDLPPAVTTPMTVRVDPPAATAEVERIRIAVLTPSWIQYLPVPGAPLPNPYACLGPQPSDLLASCTLRPGSAWRAKNSPVRTTLGSQAAEVVLELDLSPPIHPSGPLDAFNIRITPSGGGGPVGRIGGEYDKISAASGVAQSGPPGVTFEHQEIGPDIGFDLAVPGARDSARIMAGQWLSAIRKHLANEPLDVLLSRPGEDPDLSRPNLRVELAGGPHGLGGFVVDAPALRLEPVGDEAEGRTYSLAELASHPVERLEPGPYRATLDLPWGSWTKRVQVGADGPLAELVLPPTIGRPPLRNRYADGSEPAAEEADPERWSTLGEGAHIAEAAGVRLLSEPSDDGWRVEPFSRTSLPEWDLLFSASRLEAIPDARAFELVRAPQAGLTGGEFELLCLGIAYAAEARGAADLLDAALRAVISPLIDTLDYRALTYSLEALRSPGIRPDARRLWPDLVGGAAPVLRWGSDLLLRRFPVLAASGLPAVSLDPASVWSIPQPQSRAELYQELETYKVPRDLMLPNGEFANMSKPMSGYARESDYEA